MADSARPLHGEPSVHQVPGQVLFDQREAEEVAQPCQDPLGAGVRDVGQGLRERLPLQELGVGLGSIDQLVLMLVEERRSLFDGQLVGAFQGRPDVGHHGLDAVRQEGTLAFLVPERNGSLLD